MQGKTVEFEGKSLTARTLTANEWFDAEDLPTQREQDYALVAASIVDEAGSAVFSREELGAIPITTYSRLYELTLNANRPEKASDDGG